MRIDGGHSDTNDLELLAREALAQQRLEIAPRPIRGTRITQRGRFAQDENAVSSGRLCGFHLHRRRAARQGRRKEPQAELVIFDQVVIRSDADEFEESRRMAVASQAQTELDSGQNQQRYEE